jgi:uncharacterized protein with PIN domain
VEKFILTKELGRLARWLRILGYDARYFKQDNMGSLVIEALREGRLILTRNSHLPQTRGVKIILLQSEQLKPQIEQILQRLQLKPEQDKIFSRCVICNLELADIKKERIKDKVPEYVFKTQDEFFTCPGCGRIYWQGSHWGNVQAVIKELGSLE